MSEVVATGLDLLPATADRSSWTTQEAAVMDALGLRGERNVRRGNSWAKQEFEAPRPVVELFLSQCRRTGLDPMARQIYCIERGGKWGVQASIDGFRLVAERSRQYRGQTAPAWCGPDGVWRDVWLDKSAPAAARIGVYRDGFAEPLMAIATFDGYCPRDRDGGLAPRNQWATNPANQLLKCAEALALRKAFPQDLSGLYSSEEMDQASRTSAPARTQAAAPVKSGVPSVDEKAAAAWVELKDQIDACSSRAELESFGGGVDAGMMRRPIPGDRDGHTVRDYLNAAWGRLPAEPGPAADVTPLPDSGEWIEALATARTKGQFDALFKVAQERGILGGVLTDGRLVSDAFQEVLDRLQPVDASTALAGEIDA